MILPMLIFRFISIQLDERERERERLALSLPCGNVSPELTLRLMFGAQAMLAACEFARAQRALSARARHRLRAPA